jgi:hypothetical protein
MKAADINGVLGKLGDAKKSFFGTFATVDKQWTDVARKQFEEKYMETIDPNVKNIMEIVGRLGTVLTEAEQRCSDNEQ